MKKFLTVLLALSVVFTYSFSAVGSAFAATVDKTPIADAQTAAYTAIDNAGTAMLGQFTFDKDGNLTGYYVDGKKVNITSNGTDALDATFTAYISKNVVVGAIEDAKTAAKTEVQEEATKLSGSAQTEDDVTAAVAALEVKAQKVISNMDILEAGNSAKALLVEQEKITKAATNAELAAYTTSQYSDDTDEWAIAQNATYGNKYSVAAVTGLAATSDLLSAKEFVEKMLAKQIANVEAASKANAKTNQIEAIRLYKEATKIASDIINGYKGDTEAEYIAPVPTKDDLSSNTTVADAKAKTIDKMVAALTAKSVDLREYLENVIAEEDKLAKPNADKVAAARAALDALPGQIAAVKEVYTAMINAETTVTGVKALWEGPLVGSISIKEAIAGYAYTYANDAYTIEIFDLCTQRVSDVAALEAYAEQIIALVDREANPYFDESAVRDVLAKEVEKLYKGTTTLSAAKDAIKKAAAVKDGLLELRSKFIANVEGIGAAITIGTKTYAVWADEDAYEEAQLDAYKANVEKTIAAIKEATTYAAIKEAYLAGVKANETIITIEQHEKDWAANGALAKEYAKTYKTDLDAYVEYAVSKLNEDDYSNVTAPATKTTIDKAVMDIVKEAYTKEEIAAKVAEAKEYLNNLKSDKELDDAKKAVEAKVTALKTPVTIEDKAQILDAKDAYETYIELVGAKEISNKLVLTNCIDALAALELKAITDEIAALEKAVITINDAERIDALYAAIEAYDDNYEGYKDAVSAATVERVDDLAEELSTAQLENVAKLCAALSINPTTAEDVAAVSAARAAFEALTIHQQADFVSDSYELYYDKLSQIEATLANAVKEFKITASSTAKKGSITVKWKVKGLAPAADGYEVYKSKKMNSGFGTKPYFVTKKGATQYKNTKELKKGTRYYYKVRAYKVVDGKKVYSDWSNKAYRIAK